MEGVHFEKDGVHEEEIVFTSGEGLMTFQQCSSVLGTCMEHVENTFQADGEHDRVCYKNLERSAKAC